MSIANCTQHLNLKPQNKNKYLRADFNIFL